MRTARLLCAATLLPALVGAQGQQRPLEYRGWALGISFDSAAMLTQAQIGKPLICVGMDTKTMFCQTDHGPGVYASLYFSPVPRRLEEMSLLMPLDWRAARDSLEKWFISRWGPSLPRTMIGQRSAPTGQIGMATDVIGSWAREAMVFGMAAIVSVDTARTLAVSISSPARQIRLMQERADTSRKTR
jgi:hypothetical protein